MTSDGLRAAERKMRSAGISDAAIDAFIDRYSRVLAGEPGLIADADLTPVDRVPDTADLDPSADAALIDRTVIIKLNGGLGTSMGLSHAKSLIEARDGLSFLDIIVRQVLALRRRHGARSPLVLMNSFHTRDDSLASLRSHPELKQDVPGDFLQSQVPKLRADDLQPIVWPADPRLEWCPPGHGDFYTAISTSGVLDALLQHGYEYAFVSNADNLGAVLEPGILAWFAHQRIPLLAEVVIGTEADHKGGHLGRRTDGRFVIRETAQAPETAAGSFADFEHWRYYNTNNLWLDLRALARALTRQGALRLPLIINRKTVDPRDPHSPEVLQLETAMGAAITELEGAQAICVPRARFIPVKHTDDLLVLRSDTYLLTDDGTLAAACGPRRAPPIVRLDARHYQRLADFEARFPFGPPGLQACDRLTVDGNVTFGSGVVAVGSVEVRSDGGPGAVPSGAVLNGSSVATAA